MNEFKLSPQSETAVAVALRMVAQSRARVNSYTPEKRQELLESALRFIGVQGMNGSQCLNR